MKTLHRYYFWAGGVILSRLSTRVIELLEQQGVSLIENQRLELFDFERSLFTGALPASEFLYQVNAAITPVQPFLKETFLQSAIMDGGALSVVVDLEKNNQNQIVLLNDYPQEWFRDISSHNDLCKHFDRVIHLQGTGCTDDRKSVFQHLSVKGELIAGECLLVDANPFRTSLAIRRGIDAIIYVDERRLMRELRLRALL